MYNVKCGISVEISLYLCGESMSNFDNKSAFGPPVPPTQTQNFRGSQNGMPPKGMPNQNMPMDTRMNQNFPQQPGFGPPGGMQNGGMPPMHPGLPQGLPNMPSNLPSKMGGMPSNLPSNMGGMPGNLPANLSGLQNGGIVGPAGFGGRNTLPPPINNPNNFNGGMRNTPPPTRSYSGSSGDGMGSSLYMILIGVMAVLGLVGAFIAGYFIGKNNGKAAAAKTNAETASLVNATQVEIISTDYSQTIEEYLSSVNLNI